MFVFFSAEVHAQRRVLSDQLPANRWSLDVKYGVGFPFESQKGKSTLSGSIGVRYMMSKTFGIRGNYHHHYFSKSDKYSTLRTHTIGMDGVYSFSSFRPEGRIFRPRKLNILGFIGGGYTFGTHNNSKSTD
ncbi:MAG TPA: hypothetical protein VKZ78_00590, partial [Sphingobacteriaceae bacterium]|nr:hypothetical protein [Sphingobacteriaceae bacterium]